MTGKEAATSSGTVLWNSTVITAKRSRGFIPGVMAPVGIFLGEHVNLYLQYLPKLINNKSEMCKAKHQGDYDQIYLNNRHESNHCQAYLYVISLSWRR